MGDPKKSIGIILVVLVVVVLGYFYLRPGGYQAPAAPTPGAPPAPAEAPEPLTLTSEQRAIIDAGGPRAYELALSIARQSNVLAFNNCTAKPLRLRVKSGTDLSVVNNGEEDLAVKILGTSYAVPAGGTKVVKIAGGGTLTTYQCKSASAESTGMLVVTD